MQLSTLGMTPLREFNFIDPFTEQATDIFITVHPIKSKHGKAAEHKMRLKIIELMQDENNLIENEEKKLKTELITNVSLEMMSNLIVSWRGIEDEKGKQIKFSNETCLEIFKEHQELADAVYQFASTMGNFFTKSESDL